MKNNSSGFVKGYKDINLFYEYYRAEGDSKARIVFLHGAGEYSQKYTRFAEWFSGKDIDVYLLDLRGHGRSEGLRCHVDDFNDYIADLEMFLDFVESGDDRKKTFLVSHSIGGLISIFYALSYPNRFQGIVTCSPCLGLSLKVQPIKALMVSLLYPILKKWSFASHVRPHMATHDQWLIEKFKDDPLIRHAVTASFYIQMTTALQHVKNHAADLKTPILVLQAGDDYICDAKVCENFFQQAGSPDKQFKMYKGFYHELLNEVDREIVYEDIYKWIKPKF